MNNVNWLELAKAISNADRDLVRSGQKAAYDDYGVTPAQYHAGLNKLWKALKLKGVQDQDVFTLAANRIEHLTDALESIAYHGTDPPADYVDDWYKSVAYDCIRIAARGLNEKD